MLYAATGGFFYAGIFAYIAASPFAYIDYFHVPPQMYGFVFALPILGIMAVNLANTRLVMRLGGDRLCRIGAATAAIAGLVAAAETRGGFGGLIGLAAAMVVYGASSGFIVANSVAGALSAFPHRAGAASALVGSIHFGSGVVSAALIRRVRRRHALADDRDHGGGGRRELRLRALDRAGARRGGAGWGCIAGVGLLRGAL